VEPFPGVEQRMAWYKNYAPALSVKAIENCIAGYTTAAEITHLITVSCTGMSAPGLDLQVMELMQLPKNIYRTSVNFMGCYAAVHALKMADAICKTTPQAKVVIVCTELCTLHFQKQPSSDNIAAGLLFADGAAAALVTHDENDNKGIFLKHFYGEVITQGQKDMSWEISATGFLMTLSGYVPDLIETDFSPLLTRALESAGSSLQNIRHWCIHPGGKRILDAVCKTMQLNSSQLQESYHALQQYGNMSSATILFVLKNIMQKIKDSEKGNNLPEEIFGAAFGPGLTMETFIATTHA
jgi:predicted naringenin-chalcone synthase